MGNNSKSGGITNIINMDNSTLKNLTIDLLYKDREDKNYKYILDRIIRKIHENELFPMTDKLLEVLVENDLYEGKDLISQKDMRKYNRGLYSNSFTQDKDTIQIEHMYPIKHMVRDLMNMKLDNDLSIATDQVRNYLIEKTHCIFKLKYVEWDMQPKL